MLRHPKPWVMSLSLADRIVSSLAKQFKKTPDELRLLLLSDSEIKLPKSIRDGWRVEEAPEEILTTNMDGLSQKTVPELKAILKDHGASGYSKKKKAELIEMITEIQSPQGTEESKTVETEPLNALTIVKLRTLANKRGLVNYETLNKVKLIRYLESGTHPDDDNAILEPEI